MITTVKPLSLSEHSPAVFFLRHDLYVEGSEKPSTGAFHAATAVRYHPAASASSTPDVWLLSGTFQRGNLPAAITVVNLLGKTVVIRELSAVVDISKLESGIYFLRAGSWSGRFIKR